MEPRSRRCLESLDVLILAGGLGTRLRPVLGDTPKLLAPIGGRPFVDYLLDWLRDFGARRIVFALGYGASPILEHLQRFPMGGLELYETIEPKPLGTAGAIRFARAELHTDPVLVMNGDSCIDADLCAFLDHYRDVDARGDILCTEVDDASRFGRVQLDDRGFVAQFLEKDPSFHGAALVSAGHYLLSAAFLDEIAMHQAPSLEHDIFEHMPKGTLAAFVGRFPFIDIGTPDSFSRAARFFSRTQPSGSSHS